MTVQQPFAQDPGGSFEPEHIGAPVAVKISHSDDLPLRVTSRAARHGESDFPYNIGMTVQQPSTEAPGGCVEPEHIGVPVAVEVSYSDDLPHRVTSGAASHGETGSRKNIALTVQQPFTEGPGVRVKPEHIGVPIAVEVPYSDDPPSRCRHQADGSGLRNGNGDRRQSLIGMYTLLSGIIYSRGHVVIRLTF
jgi:hypothetical protein